MKKKSVQAFICCFAAITIISAFCILIFELSVQKRTTDLVKELSTLTDQNAMQWASSPGEYGIPMIHSFQLFNYGGKSESGQHQFDLLPAQYNYTQKYDLKNRTYIPSSPGYVKYLRYTSYVANFDETKVTDNVTQFNLVPPQKFYRQLQAPLMQKIPQYLYIVLNTLQNDFLLSYFTSAIHSYYIYDETLTRSTIFAFIDMTQEQQDALWNDPQYGWQTELTFKSWVRYALLEEKNYQGIYSLLSEQFNLTTTQMNALVGPQSTIIKMIRMVLGSVSDGIMDDLQGNCKLQICTLQELASIQWGRGTLSRVKLFNGEQYPAGYSSMNESIPAYDDDQAFEYYLADEQNSLSIDQSKQLSNFDVEYDQSLLDFFTQNTLIRFMDNPAGIMAKLQLQSEDTARAISLYLQRITKWVNGGFPLQLAQDAWRMMSQLIGNGSNLLRNGLHAKALYYQGLNCSDVLSGSDLSSKICGNPSLDFTMNAKNGMIWVEATLLQNQINVGSFINLRSIFTIKCFDQIQTTDDILSNLLWSQDSLLRQKIQNISTIISQQFKCQNPLKCSSQELFLLQWFDCYVTLNPPESLQFKQEDKVCGLGKWDVVDQPSLYYELGAYFSNEAIVTDLKLSKPQIKLMLSYDMGGILGYYSIYNLTSYVHPQDPSQSHLNIAFPLDIKQATLITNYIKKALITFTYGGLMIQTKTLDYLWSYENEYTKKLFITTPLEGGANWKNNAASLFEKNNKLFTDTATSDDFNQIDSGLNDINQVRRMVKILGDRIIKSKQIVYKNPNSNNTQSFYYYPFDLTEVSGSEGLGFSPNLAEAPDQHEMFDWNIQNRQKLTKLGSSEYFALDSSIYNYSELKQNLSKLEHYPIYVSANSVLIECLGLMNGQDCQEYQRDQLIQEDNQVVIEKVSGFVVSNQRTYTYWLNLGDYGDLIGDDNFPKNMIPLAIKRIALTYDKTNIQQVLGEVKDISDSMRFYFTLFLILAGIFTLFLMAALVYYCKNKGNFDSPVNEIVVPNSQYLNLSA